MKCLRCQSENLVCAEQIQLIRFKHPYHDSTPPLNTLVCFNCGHVEFILPQELIEEQKKHFEEDKRGY